MAQGENLGSIYYTVDAKTEALVKAEQAVANSTKKVSAELDKTSVRYARLERVKKQYISTLTKSGKIVSANGVVLDKFGKVSDTATSRIARLNTEMENIKKASDGMGKAASTASPKMSMLAQSVQNASYQVQDFTVQLAGGQNAILAASQQIPQLLGSFGAMGAAIGAVVAIAGGLYLTFGNTKTAIEIMQKGVENLEAAMTLGADGIVTYTDEMKRLKDISEGLARIEIGRLLGEQNEIIKNTGKALKQSVSDAQGWSEDYTAVYKIFKNETDKAREAFKELKNVTENFTAENAEQSLEDLEKALNMATAAGINNTATGRKLVEEMVAVARAYKDGKERVEDLEARLKDLNFTQDESIKKNKEQKESVTNLIGALKEQARVLTETDRQTAVRLAASRGATRAELWIINKQYDKIEAILAEQKAIEDAGRARQKSQSAAERESKARARQAEQLDKELEIYFINEEIRDRKRAERQKKIKDERIKSTATSISGRLNPVEALREQKAQELQVLREAEEQGLKLHADYATLRAQVNESFRAKEMAAIEQRFAAESETNALIINGLNSLEQTAGQVFGGMLTQTMSVTDAVRGFANAIVNDLIGSLVSVGIQYIKNAVLQETANQAMMANDAAMMATKSANHTAAVTATVAELTSISSLATFASTSAIPITGPVLAPAAAAGALTYASALGAPAIAAAPIAGARLYGGSVAPNSNYTFAEDGRPEMFTDGKSAILSTGSSGGQVINNKDLMGMMGGAKVEVNVKNYGGQNIDVQQSTKGEGMSRRDVIDIIVGDITSGGKTQRAITRSTTAKGRTN